MIRKIFTLFFARERKKLHTSLTRPAASLVLVPVLEKPYTGVCGARHTRPRQEPTWMESHF